MSFEHTQLVCTRCGQTYSAQKPLVRCPACNDTLEVVQPEGAEIRQGDRFTQTLFERYAAFFPYFDIDRALDLGEGFTPLLEMPRIAEQAGVAQLFVKNESVNPTWSFKDRGTAAGVRRALQLGYERVGTVSTGNMAISVAALGQRAGLRAFILVNTHIDEEKLNPIAIYDPCLIKVAGDYAALYDESLRIGAEQGIYFINADEPFRIDGYRTLAFELCEQFGFDMPDYVVVPTSAGGHFRGILKGFLDFQRCGLIQRVPRMVCAQATGCATINNAYAEGLTEIRRTPEPNTLAHSIENAFPPSGNAVLRQLRAYDGLCVSVSDQDLLDAQRLLCRNGLFVQPGSAASVAAVLAMQKLGLLTGTERITCVATSTGLKYTSILSRQELTCHETRLEELSDFIAGL